MSKTSLQLRQTNCPQASQPDLRNLDVAEIPKLTDTISLGSRGPPHKGFVIAVPWDEWSMERESFKPCQTQEAQQVGEHNVHEGQLQLRSSTSRQTWRERQPEAAPTATMCRITAYMGERRPEVNPATTSRSRSRSQRSVTSRAVEQL